mmetsp:Transcript_24107/g.33288  ORF Transcript_24107/g.33288 Transcript_24107/m.33288 type:complete len:242 (-) Transcript_24107:286-1011(-)
MYPLPEYLAGSLNIRDSHFAEFLAPIASTILLFAVVLRGRKNAWSDPTSLLGRLSSTSIFLAACKVRGDCNTVGDGSKDEAGAHIQEEFPSSHASQNFLSKLDSHTARPSFSARDGIVDDSCLSTGISPAECINRMATARQIANTVKKGTHEGPDCAPSSHLSFSPIVSRRRAKESFEAQILHVSQALYRRKRNDCLIDDCTVQDGCKLGRTGAAPEVDEYGWFVELGSRCSSRVDLASMQ